jgi:hypothetical protein
MAGSKLAQLTHEMIQPAGESRVSCEQNLQQLAHLLHLFVVNIRQRVAAEKQASKTFFSLFHDVLEAEFFKRFI